MASTVQSFVKGYVRAFAVTGEKTILVDSGARAPRATLERGLARCGVNPPDVSLIVVTHAHTDHVGPLPELAYLTGAPVMCHEAAAAGMAEGFGEPLRGRTTFGRLMERIGSHPPERNRRPFSADLVITTETDLAPYGVAGTVLPTPGHTAGSVSVVLESGEAIIGDLVMAIGPGRPKLSFLSNNGGELRASLRELLDRGIHTFHLSHGGAWPREAIERLVR